MRQPEDDEYSSTIFNIRFHGFELRTTEHVKLSHWNGISSILIARQTENYILIIRTDQMN